MKKIPPFGKLLDELIKSGYRPNNDINVFIGARAWEKGNAFSISYPTRTLILPPWNSAHSYYWPVKNCDILIFETPSCEASYKNDVAIALYENGASKVRLITFFDNNLIIYHKE